MKTLSNILALLCIAIGVSAPASAALGPSKETRPDELGWGYEYDDADRVTKITNPAEQDTRFDYTFFDAKEKQHLHERLKTAADGSKVTHQFDKDGRLLRIKDSAGDVTYGYDPRGKLNRVERTGEPAINYDRDLQGRIRQLQVGDFKLEYRYDFMGRLASLNTPLGPIEYNYQTGLGVIERKYPNGIHTFSHYEANGELLDIKHGYFANPADTSYELIAEFNYQYRPDGLIASITEQSELGQTTKAYEYDKVSRLIKANYSDGQAYTYDYDPLGNRLKDTGPKIPTRLCEVDWAGRITRFDGIPATHDRAGNLTSVTVGGEALNYGYTPENQLAESGGKVSYGYDGEGRMINRKVGNIETRFIPDPLSSNWQPLVMETKGGSRTFIVWEGATPLLLIKDGKPEYLMHDHLGSVRLVSDAQGKIIQRFDYEPFGALLNPEKASEFAPRFAGLFWDAEAKAYLTLARGYRPDLGRFIGIEPQRRLPFGAQKDLSVYAYSGDDPVNFVDRDGAEYEKSNSAYIKYAFGDESPSSIKDIVDRLNQIPNKTYFPAQELDFWPDQWKGKWNPSEYKLPNNQNIDMNWVALFSKQEHSLIGAGIIIAGHIGWLVYSALELTPLPVVQMEYTARSEYKKKNLPYKDQNIPNLLFKEMFIENNIGRKIENIFVNRISAELGSLLWVKNGGFLNKTQHTGNSSLSPSHVGGSYVLGAGNILSETSSADGIGEKFTKPLPSNLPIIEKPKLQPIEIQTKRPPSNEKSTFPLPPSPPPPPQLGNIGSDHTGGIRSGWNDRRPPSGGSSESVGGVALGGSGQLLKGLGALEGIGKDDNGNLILLGKSGDDIKLPSLRLDDVVTVFRSVYLNGEGPTVTIDPNPSNPKGPTMVIRHSKATDGTYVGWVLFHADRIMKSYNLGKDNITKAELKSNVPGYAQLLDTIYFGNNTKQEANWERFWIVPAEARRFAVLPDQLTLFDVPLKVRTQPMKWVGGMLVDDANRPPSVGATAFTEWFTGHYDGIDKEQYLLPPKESGITEPVPVFSELRRIALMTAMAERLRDQGVPLPFWMRDYTVRPVLFEKTTPTLDISKTKGQVLAHIYGGVSLSPDDANVKTYSQPTDVSKLPKPEQVAAQHTLKRSESLIPVLRQTMQGAEPLQVKAFTHEGVNHQALALPGADTLALAPVRLNEVDLNMPMDGGGSIQLLRSFHSFFNPNGPWGEGWALDLPRLETSKLPVARSDQGQATYQFVYDVVTPLNSASARFSKIEEVPELGGVKLLVPDQAGEFLALAGDESLDFVTTVKQSISGENDGQKSMKLIGKDGSIWHFSPVGDLIATENAGFRTVYERNNGQITGIAGLKGKYRMASIKLNYDKAGRLISATGQQQVGDKTTDKSTVKYTYDASGKLVSLSSDTGSTGYQYQSEKVAAITYKGPGKADLEKTVWRFEYNALGQLLAKEDASGAKTQYHIATDATGSTLTTTSSGKDVNPESIQYDPAFRPVQATYADGSKAAWTYGKDGTSLVLAGAEGDSIRMTESTNQRQRTLELSPQHKLVGDYDTAGRLLNLKDNGELLLRQEWQADGRLRFVANDTSAVHPEYDADGLVSRVVLTPPEELGQHVPFNETKLDRTGKPLEITDYTGLQVHLGYEQSGELQGMTIKRDGQDLGFTIKRDESGRIQAVNSSWDKQRFAYDKHGLLNKVNIERDKAHSSAEWKDGRLLKVSQFDGGETKFNYGDNGVISQITAPNGLVLGYEHNHDQKDRLQKVALGDSANLSLDYDEAGRVKRWAYQAAGK